MARYGTWRPLASNWSLQPRMQRYDVVCLHTMVGSLWGTDGYFRADGYGGSESHFGVGHDGEVLQWQDTTRQADANYLGNHRVISIETADMGTGFTGWTGSDVPAWTQDQLDALVKLIAWACHEHDIPCELIPDAKSTRRGVGYHRQGVEGYMVPGAEKWSSKRGKVCPGDRRVAQIPEVVRRAKRLLDGIATTETTPTRRTENVLQNIRIEPGKGNLRLNVPTGKASLVVSRAWISASVDGPEPGSVHLYFQDDDSGLDDVPLPIGFADGRSVRTWWECPDGTTTVNINYDMPDGGVITVEALSR